MEGVPDPLETVVYRTSLTTRFRGLDARDGVLLRGEAGWGEFSPFWDYDDAESAPWLRAAPPGPPPRPGGVNKTPPPPTGGRAGGRGGGV
ncbi:hypothetical protein ACFWH7_15870, partial [Cellulosimicrobium cellulans]